MRIGTAAQEFENACYLYERICLFCGIAAIVFLLLSAILFFVLHIPRAWETFAGRPARKEAGDPITAGDMKSALGAETSALAPEEEGPAQGSVWEQETVLLEGEVIRR